MQFTPHILHILCVGNTLMNVLWDKNLLHISLTKLSKLNKILNNEVPSKHFNVVSALSICWYNVATWDNVKSTLKQRCVFQRWNLQRRTTSNQRCVFQRWYVETTLSFSTPSFTMLVNVETTLWKWLFLKITKQILSNKIHGIQSLNY